MVFLLNVVPAFAPPTWLVMAYVGLRFPFASIVAVAFTAALAATLGRVVLAAFSRTIVRRKLLSEAGGQNVDAIRQGLEGKKKMTAGALLLYAFTPFPSNYLFIAYGLTTLDLRTIALPFFIGRSVSYSFWSMSSSALTRRISMESGGAWAYLGTYFVISQFAFLGLVYVFTKIDWRALAAERKLKWVSNRLPVSGVSGNRP